MAWSNLPAAAGCDWTAPAFCGQFLKAANERATVIGRPALPLYHAGAIFSFGIPLGWQYWGLYGDSQEWFDIRGIQAWQENNCGKFYPADAASINPDYTGFTLAQFRQAAGLNADGFTRKWRVGAGAVQTGHGLGRSGDFMGPWIWNELQAGFNALTRTYVTSAWYGMLGGLPYSGSGGSSVSAAAAIAAFAWGGYGADSPCSYTDVSSRYGSYWGSIRTRMIARADFPPGARITGTAQWYILPNAKGVWDAQGSGFTQGRFNLFGQSAYNGSDLILLSPVCNDGAAPTNFPTMPPYPPGGENMLGWQSFNNGTVPPLCVMDWAFTYR